MLKVLDLFSGIGGFSLGLERTGGFKTIAFCEIDPFCQKVLKKHWPEIPIYEDVKNVTKARLEADGIGRIDILTGGFPCQDISVAGKQEGIEGKHSGLWSELARIISDIRPKYAIVENVTALLSGDRGGWFGRVLGDLVEIGFNAEWHCIRACRVGLPQHRDRVWLICYPKQIKQPWVNGVEITRPVSNRTWIQTKISQGFRSPTSRTPEGYDTAAPKICRVSDGIPNITHRLGSLGNSVVPQIPEIIGRAILSHETQVSAPND